MNFLNFPDWILTDLTEHSSSYFLRAIYQSARVRCSRCLSSEENYQKYGVRLKNIKDAPVRGKTVSILLKIQRYKCLKCNLTFQAEVSELIDDSRFTKRLISYIEREAIKKSFLTVARETGVSESTVRNIFMNFIKEEGNLPVFETPTILGIDDVYINRVACCILTDIEERRIFDILPGRQMETVYNYLIKLKDKENIEIVAMDMSRPFASSVTDALPGAEIVIDTFHIQRMGNKSINIFLRDLRNSLNMSKRRLLLRDRFILMKRSFSLDPQEKQLLSEWRAKLPALNKIYELKEEFFQIWRISNRADAEIAYSIWQEKIPVELRFVFQEILTAFEGWEHQIFNYFDYKVTNAFTESANNLVKNFQKQARGCSFEVVRAKALCRYL